MAQRERPETEKTDLTAEDVRQLVKEKIGSKRGAIANLIREATGAARAPSAPMVYMFLEGHHNVKNPPKVLLEHLGLKQVVVYRKKCKPSPGS